MKTTSIPQLFEAVNLAIYNTSEHEDIQKKMSGYGFTPKRIQEGKALLEQSRLMDSTQEEHYDDARRMSAQIQQDSDAALEVFADHVAIARSAFRKEPNILQELKINKMATGRWGKTQQAMGFYGKAPMYMERLQQYGATQESFQQNEAAVEALLAQKAQRMKKKGDAENSTQERNQTIKELRGWYGEFRKLARIAFQETPQILETFGIVVPTTKRKRKVTA